MLSEMRFGADAGEEEKMRRADGASAEDHFSFCTNSRCVELPAMLKLHPARCLPLQLDLKCV